MLKKFLSVMLFLMTIVNFQSISSAATPTTPLANITVYKFFKNMGYEIDTSRPASRTPDGFPIYGTNLPLNGLIQSNQFANVIVVTNKNGDKILGIKLFIQYGANKAEAITAVSKTIQGIDRIFTMK